MKLEETVALVTGANRGLGKAFVQALLESGATRVYAAARDPSGIESTDRVVPIRLDVTSPEDADRAAQTNVAGPLRLIQGSHRAQGRSAHGCP